MRPVKKVAFVLELCILPFSQSTCAIRCFFQKFPYSTCEFLEYVENISVSRMKLKSLAYCNCRSSFFTTDLDQTIKNRNFEFCCVGVDTVWVRWPSFNLVARELPDLAGQCVFDLATKFLTHFNRTPKSHRFD
ncbi:hypothetical protein T07_660 [Trichinella nelsoni]|uniref:Secreted protein n=1 Tax=Trichinella nelsoni TaxID=6336 RepID=A0A0V0S7A2_9BILA|nr:hypothetical protein T07_660 [Trichinella nelsoni]